MGVKAFGCCTEVIFHRDAMSLLESSAHLGTTNSDERGCIGRKVAVVDEVEGSCAAIYLVNSDAILGQQKLSHILIRILIRSMDVCSAGH